MIHPGLLLAACLPLAGAGDRITAGDLAAAEPAFAALAPETPLANSPQPGTRRMFPVAELERLGAQHGLALAPHAPVCLEDSVAPLDSEKLLAAMRASLALPDARIELVEFSRYPVPRGVIEFPLAGLARPANIQVPVPALWKGVVRYGDSRKFAIWARVRLTASAECLVAAETLSARRPIAPSQLKRKTYTGFPLFDIPVAEIEQAAAHVPRRTIPAGSPILPDMLDAPFDVLRGDSVEVEVASGEAFLKLEGRAEADGRRGQMIPVLNPASGRHFQARIESGRKVVVGVHP